MSADAYPSLTVVVLALNEATDIAGCVRSVTIGQEILLLDSGSTDGTVEQAQAAVRCVPLRVACHPFRNYSAQRNVALGLVTTDWVLFLDADERLTPALEAEVADVLRRPDADAYWIPRRNILLGRWMRHTGWYPDEQLRLLRREAVQYDEARPVHEVAEVRGATGHLASPLIHINYRSLAEFARQQQRYAAYEAEQLARSGPVWRRALIGQPIREFIRRYVHLHGYRDGGHGLLFSLLLAYYRLQAVRRARVMGDG